MSGSITDGMWETPITFPQYSPFGEWRLSHVFIEDNVGNVAHLGSVYGTYPLSVTTAPEPSSIVMAAMALAALAWFGLRRRRYASGG